MKSKIYFLLLLINIVSYINAYQCVIRSYSDFSKTVEKCSDILVATDIVVPPGNVLNLNLLTGAKITFNASVTFEYFEWKGPLVKITGSNIYVSGKNEGSIFNGQGNLYWDGRGGSGITTKPKFVTIEASNNSILENISLKNCPLQCVTVKNSRDVILNGWNIGNSDGQPGVAPSGHEGHNTDGFDVLSSDNVIIRNSHVDNQDDCIAVSRGSNMLFSQIYCNGSHGLSLSASFNNEKENYLENVTYSNCFIQNSANAIHVKTHTNSSVGIIKNITYKNIEFSGITNYVINIQQDYESGGSTGKTNNNINITELNMINIHGTVANQKTIPVYIYCGDGSCSNWSWSNLNISNGNKALDKCNFIPDGYKC